MYTYYTSTYMYNTAHSHTISLSLFLFLSLSLSLSVCLSVRRALSLSHTHNIYIIQERQRRIQEVRAGKTPLDQTQTPPAQHSPSAATPSPRAHASPHAVDSPGVQGASKANMSAEISREDVRTAGRERTVFQPESNGVEAGTRLVLPSELKNGVVKRKTQKAQVPKVLSIVTFLR